MPVHYPSPNSGKLMTREKSSSSQTLQTGNAGAKAARGLPGRIDRRIAFGCPIVRSVAEAVWWLEAAAAKMHDGSRASDRHANS